MKKLHWYFLILFIFITTTVHGATKITELSDLPVPVGADLLICVDDVAGTATTKKCTITNVLVDANIPDTITIDTATVGTTVTITDNESTAETNAIIFTSAGDLDGGDIGLESDGDLTYTPSTGNISATAIGGITEANLVDKSADETISGNWVNTANPWADNEVANDITVDETNIASTITRDTEWDTMAEINAASTDTDAVLDTDIGSTVQAWDAELDTISGLSETTGNVMIAVGSAWASVAQPAIDCTNCTSIPAGSSHADTLTWSGTPLLESGTTFQFGDGTDATITHTYGNTGTDVSIAYSTAAMAVTGVLTATNLSGTNTGDDATDYISEAELASEADLETQIGSVDVVTITTDDITSANLATAVSNETGSGLLVFGTSPTLVTPILGTPTSGNGSNLTALNATQLTTGTVPVARVGTAHIDAATEIGNDIITHAQILDADQTDTKCGYIEDPVAESFVSFWANKTANDFQVTEIWGESDQTISIHLQVDDGTPANCDTNPVSPAAGEAEELAIDGDCLVSAGEELDVVLSSPSGTPTFVSICFTGNWVD